MSDTAIGWSLAEWLFGGWSLGKGESRTPGTLARVTNAKPSEDAAEALVARGRAWITDDPELVARFRAGDDGAFKTVFDTYWDTLCALASRYVRSTDAAEDVVQTVFLRLLELRSAWPVGRPIRGFLLVATRNAAIQAARHTKQRTRNADAILETSPAIPRPPIVPDRAMTEEEIAVAVRGAIESLTPRVRTVAMHRIYDGMSRAEIAALMGTSEHTVHRQLVVAMSALREQLRTFR